MAMSALPGGDEDSEGAVFAEINITPLTDIFLVLLIIFMVTSSVIVNQGPSGAKAGLKVTLPKGSSADVTTPPIIGAAIRFITSAPACVAGDHMIGSNPNNIAQTVMTLGRMRCTAPSRTASSKSGSVFILPAARNFSHAWSR